MKKIFDFLTLFKLSSAEIIANATGSVRSESPDHRVSLKQKKSAENEPVFTSRRSLEVYGAELNVTSFPTAPAIKSF
jgi:hypothetical protein